MRSSAEDTHTAGLGRVSLTPPRAHVTGRRRRVLGLLGLMKSSWLQAAAADPGG